MSFSIALHDIKSITADAWQHGETTSVGFLFKSMEGVLRVSCFFRDADLPACLAEAQAYADAINGVAVRSRRLPVLEADEITVLRTLLEFHRDHADPDKHFDYVPFAGLCAKMGVDLPMPEPAIPAPPSTEGEIV